MYTSQNISSGVGKSLFWKIQNKGPMYFCRDILMGHHKEKNKKILNYCIEEWYSYTTYDISQNHSTYPTVCLSLYTWHRNDHCITVCGKWIFDSNFEVDFSLTQDLLDCTCRGNDTDEIKFVGVLHTIRAVPTEVFQRKLNMK